MMMVAVQHQVHPLSIADSMVHVPKHMGQFVTWNLILIVSIFGVIINREK